MLSDIEILEISKKYGTPSYIFDLEDLEKRVRLIKKIINNRYRLCYSIKANPFLTEEMAKIVDSLEVCSPGELKICKALNINPKKIIYSGVNKTEIDIKEAMEYNVGIFTAESIRQLELVNIEAQKEGKIVNMILRLNAGSQFGMSTNDFEYVLQNYTIYKNIKVIGIHYFSGTQNNISKQKKEIEKLKKIIIYYNNKFKIQFEHIEYGPGLSASMFKKDDFSDTLQPLRDINDDLLELASLGDLTIEMGRFFTTYCGTFLTSAMDIKENEGVNYCIIDGGINHISYFGSMMGMNVPIIKQFSMNNSYEEVMDDKKYCICGSLCSTNDVVVRQYITKNISIGDLFAFYNIGAYSITEGIYLFLSRDMPKVILRYKAEDYKVVRDVFNTYTLNMSELIK